MNYDEWTELVPEVIIRFDFYVSPSTFHLAFHV